MLSIWVCFPQKQHGFKNWNVHVNFFNTNQFFYSVAQILYIGCSRIRNVSDYFFREFVKSRLAISLFFHTINCSTPQQTKTTEDNLVIEGSVYLNDVYFGYPTCSKIIVLKGIDLNVPAGTCLLIMGPHGCGKSTLLSLIEGFYEPSCGSIVIDGIDLRNISLKTFREQVAYVEQGYDTIIGEENRSFPAPGQRHRIALARALFRKPKILLLDELADNLDFASEKLIMEAMENASHSRTCIRVLGYRRPCLEAQKNHQIVWLEQGKIIENGTHEQLMSMHGKYYSMFRKFY